MITQEGDVLIYQTDDNGEINIEDGVAEMSGGLPTATYLSLFGGNLKDSGDDENKYEWWGNSLDTETERKYRSRTQYLVNNIPITTANLKRLQDAVQKDLEWVLVKEIATEIEVSISVSSLNRVNIAIDINQEKLKFVTNWEVKA